LLASLRAAATQAATQQKLFPANLRPPPLNAAAVQQSFASTGMLTSDYIMSSARPAGSKQAPPSRSLLATTASITAKKTLPAAVSTTTSFPTAAAPGFGSTAVPQKLPPIGPIRTSVQPHHALVTPTASSASAAAAAAGDYTATQAGGTERIGATAGARGCGRSRHMSVPAGSLSGADVLAHFRSLDLSAAHITSLDPAARALPSLLQLNLSRNMLRVLTALPPSLRVLNAFGNAIEVADFTGLLNPTAVAAAEAAGTAADLQPLHTAARAALLRYYAPGGFGIAAAAASAAANASWPRAQPPDVPGMPAAAAAHAYASGR
jgi:hypothetical protein